MCWSWELYSSGITQANYAEIAKTTLKSSLKVLVEIYIVYNVELTYLPTGLVSGRLLSMKTKPKLLLTPYAKKKRIYHQSLIIIHFKICWAEEAKNHGLSLEVDLKYFILRTLQSSSKSLLCQEEPYLSPLSTERSPTQHKSVEVQHKLI